mmetsp:Transcript_104981/g.306695  ORF Transcript_104981/g.306695 Transcript_104981/m.306695 type:complete len:239 (+) Transcript_104981:489-1205(+)
MRGRFSTNAATKDSFKAAIVRLPPKDQLSTRHHAAYSRCLLPQDHRGSSHCSVHSCRLPAKRQCSSNPLSGHGGRLPPEDQRGTEQSSVDGCGTSGGPASLRASGRSTLTGHRLCTAPSNNEGAAAPGHAAAHASHGRWDAAGGINAPGARHWATSLILASGASRQRSGEIGALKVGGLRQGTSADRSAASSASAEQRGIRKTGSRLEHGGAHEEARASEGGGEGGTASTLEGAVLGR